MSEWNHVPDLPLQVNPLWQWPPRPAEVLRWYAGAWIGLTVNVCILGLSLIAWRFFSPTLIEAASPGLWMIEVLLRNAVILIAVAGVLNWWFHGAERQGRIAKYDPRPYPRAGRMFTGGNQLRDNVIWTLASALPVWSLLECLIWMGLGQGWIASATLASHPIWFFAFFFALPIWESFYFYWIHRALHSGWLYRFHALHHRNTDVGPWSGLSMHPVEHVMFFGSVLIHVVLPTHPLHLIYHLQFYALYAVVTHTGHEGLWLRGAKRLHLGNFHHQMHHRYFEVNYGTLEIPWDKVFGTFHDGSDAGRDMMRERLKSRRRA
jgi:sterol desaturase/sphingolipid hydroxylase (fatty acid hydroxylase superfamily)